MMEELTTAGGGVTNKRKRADSTRAAKAAMSDEELAIYFETKLESIHCCGNKACNCLDDLFTHPKHRSSVAQYLVWFEQKSKYDQDCVIAEWCKYAFSSRNIVVQRFMLPYMSQSYIRTMCCIDGQMTK